MWLLVLDQSYGNGDCLVCVGLSHIPPLSHTLVQSNPLQLLHKRLSTELGLIDWVLEILTLKLLVACRFVKTDAILESRAWASTSIGDSFAGLGLLKRLKVG